MIKSLIDRFTTTPLIGVDIGSAALKVVEISQEEDKVILRRCGIASAEGEDTVDALKKLLEASGVTTTTAAISVSSSDVIAKPFEYPPMPGKELSKAIRLEAEQEATHGKSEMTVDWHAFPSNGGEATRGLLAVVPKSTLNRHLDIAKKAGLRPVIADVAGLALWNAYWTLLGSKETAPKTVLLMNIGAKTTNLIIAKGPATLILSRDFNLGAKALTEGHETEWSAEVRDSLGYARSHGGMRALDDVYVTGGGSDRNLKLLLSQMAGVPIVFWNPLENITRSPGLSVDDASGPLLAVAIGLALRKPT